MKHHKDLITDAIPEERRKLGHDAGVAHKYPGNWTESSMDLMAGLEVVELPAEGQWAETMPSELEPLKNSP